MATGSRRLAILSLVSRKSWIGFSRFKCSLTATIEEKPCGIATLFLMPYQKVCHNSFFYMIVGKEYRRKKIGTSLLKNLKNLGHKYFNLEGIHAEIFSHCPIIPLLEKQGFTPIFTQEKFVKIEKKYLSRTLYECLF
jgi:GNAT superfamily N-acetyltransferase